MNINSTKYQHETPSSVTPNHIFETIPRLREREKVAQSHPRANFLWLGLLLKRHMNHWNANVKILITSLANYESKLMMDVFTLLGLFDGLWFWGGFDLFVSIVSLENHNNKHTTQRDHHSSVK